MAVADSGSATPSAATRLITRWATLGVPVRPGCPTAELDAFEARTGRTLPADLRAFLQAANGVEADAEGFSFWPVEAYESVDRVVAEHGQNWPEVPDPMAYYVFCDYLQWSWGYAIRLGRSGDEGGGNEVIPVGMNERCTVATSFTEFVDLYLAGSPRLYPA